MTTLETSADLEFQFVRTVQESDSAVTIDWTMLMQASRATGAGAPFVFSPHRRSTSRVNPPEGRNELPHGESELGRRLRALRAKIVASGAPLLDWQEIEQEVRERRGEQE